MAKVDRLGFARFEVRDIDAWRDHIRIMYGLELLPVDGTEEFEVLIDDTGHHLRFREGPADDIVTVGWVAEADQIDELQQQLDKLGCATEFVGDAEAALVSATRMLRTTDSLGITSEIIDKVGSRNPFVSADYDHRFVTGELGFGHLTFCSLDLESFEKFYVEGLGLVLSDYNQVKLPGGLKRKVGFYRANSRHHSVACAPLVTPRQRVQHFFLEVESRKLVDAGYERVCAAGVPIAHSVGVHPNDNLYTFYSRSPSGFQTELGTGGYLHDGTRPVQTFQGMSEWGHDMPLGQLLRVLPIVARTITSRFRS
jgi:2,3-dihydroxybiphenyl 1,2-dioxygenase